MRKIQYMWIIGIMALLVVAGCSKAPLSIAPVENSNEKQDISNQLETNNAIDARKIGLKDGETVDSSVLKKEAYDKVIRENPNYCFGKNSDSDCICQENYVKYFDNFITSCMPSLCQYVLGIVMLGDDEQLGKPNYEYCEWAVRDGRSDVCDDIGYQQGRDICRLAYVGRTNNLEECEKIEDENLKNECYS